MDHLRRDLHNSTYHLPTGRSGLFPPLSGIRFAGLPLGIISLSYRFHIVFITHSPQKAKKIPLVFRCPTTCLCLHNIVFSFALLSLCPWSSFCCWSSVVFLVLVQLPVLFFVPLSYFHYSQQKIEPLHYSICPASRLVLTLSTLSPR